MKRLVADTGPILHLYQAGALHLLPLVGEVTLSPNVLAEIRRHAPQLWPTQMPAWLKPASPSTAALQRALAWQQAGLLHGGEAEALAVACESRPDWRSPSASSSASCGSRGLKPCAGSQSSNRPLP